MIDLHSHILPGIDDGAADLSESIAIAREAERDGVTTIAGTPHVREDHPTTVDAMLGALVVVRSEVAASGIATRVVAGGEVAVDRLRLLGAEGLREFSLGGNGRYVLLETPDGVLPPRFADIIGGLVDAGVSPVLAHPERCLQVHERPERLRPMLEAGALVQVTAASLDGGMGPACRRTARALVDRGLAHMVATDVHAPGGRGAMSQAVAALDDPDLARWMTLDVGEAILSGEDAPQRPSARRRNWFGRR